MELAVAVYDRATRESAVGDRGTEPFYTASLAKVVVAIDMLDRRRLDGLTITDEDIGLLRRALGPSDDSAMNALWTKFDGQGAGKGAGHRRSSFEIAVGDHDRCTLAREPLSDRSTNA